MKFYLLLIGMLTILVSCHTNDDKCFSCDNSVNEWAHLNANKIQAMSRLEIANLSGEKQRAAFRSLTNEGKKKFGTINFHISDY